MKPRLNPIIASLFLLLPVTVQGAVMVLTSGASSYNVGGNIEVLVYANSEGSNLVVADAVINYDRNVLQLQSIDVADSAFSYDFGPDNTALFPIRDIDNETGQVRVVTATPSPGLAGAQLNVARLHFTPIAASPGTTVSAEFSGVGAVGDSNLIVDDGQGSDALTSVINLELAITESNDTDSDGVPDNQDNCTEIENPDQYDSDGDGYGNICDGDLDGSGFVNSIDLGLFKLVFFTADADADLNGDGFVNSLDLGLFKQLFFKAPGPSANTP